MGLSLKIRSFFKKILSKEFLVCFSLVCIIVFLDQLIKFFIKDQTFDGSSFLGFSLEKVKNNYFIFVLNITGDFFFVYFILLSLWLSFSFYYFVFVYYFKGDKKYYPLKIAVSLVFGGWFSNLIDKLMQSYVLDYIKWEIFNFVFYFNLADIIQTCGWIVFMYYIISLRSDIFRRHEKRSRWIIFNKLQYQFLAYFTLIFGLIALFFILLIYQLFVAIGVLEDPSVKSLVVSFFKGLLVALVFLYIFVGSFFAYFSNKIYGPVYAFEKYIRSIMAGKKDLKKFHLRQNDHFENLEVLAEDIKNHIEAKTNSENKNKK